MPSVKATIHALTGPLLLMALAACDPQQQHFDTLIRGGTIYDGTGSPAYAADVGIRGDRIHSLGDLGGHRRYRHRCHR